MIADAELRAIAQQRNLPLDMVEKDYVLGWILFGIASSAVSGSLAFKGGTALSKVYFPGKWRLSEDLDFTPVDNTEMLALGTGIIYEVPSIVKKASGIDITIKGDPLANLDFFRSKISYTGPLSKNKIKIEISREPFLGKVIKKPVPQEFDYPKFSVKVYSLDNLLSEKMRALVERHKIRDYYDVWRLLKTGKFDRQNVKRLFLKKCESKGVAFTGIEQIFPADLIKTLEPYMDMWLTRLSAEPLPPLAKIVQELRVMLEDFIAQDA